MVKTMIKFFKEFVREVVSKDTESIPVFVKVFSFNTLFDVATLILLHYALYSPQKIVLIPKGYANYEQRP